MHSCNLLTWSPAIIPPCNLAICFVALLVSYLQAILQFACLCAAFLFTNILLICWAAFLVYYELAFLHCASSVWRILSFACLLPRFLNDKHWPNLFPSVVTCLSACGLLDCFLACLFAGIVVWQQDWIWVIWDQCYTTLFAINHKQRSAIDGSTYKKNTPLQYTGANQLSLVSRYENYKENII